MKKLSKPIGIFIAIVIVHIVSTAYAQESGPSLWIADDGTKTVYEVTVDDGPEVKSSFGSLMNANSGIAIDPSDDTLWGACEHTVGLPRGCLVNFGKDGSFLWQIPAADFGAFGVEGVAVDYFDGSLWVVDDPVGLFPGEVPTVHHISKDGTVIDSFPTPTLETPAESPQAIAADPLYGTLWITDNSSPDWVYNIDRDGTLITSFRVKVYDTFASNPQGISVDDSDGTLWVTDRTSQMIYNITRTGDLITSFKHEYSVIASKNPTAIAFDWRAAMTRLHAVIDDLQWIVDDLAPGVSGDDKEDRDLIVDAIEHIEKSLKLKQWLDRATPHPKTKVGEKVFKENKKAVGGGRNPGLLEVKNTNGVTDVSSAIAELVDIHFGLARSAYVTATGEVDMICEADPFSEACTKADDKIADAAKKLVEAQKEWDKGDPEKAIGKCKDAWKKAREAIKNANPDNTKPVANTDTLTTAIEQALWFQLTGSDPDGDDLFFVLDNLPDHGTLVLNSVSGVGLYTPYPGFDGDDSMTFRANDGILDSDKREVKFKVE